ncbi:MAG: diaminopimelate decarboxylase [Bacteroidetes bacterium]|nr:diaminopimelate decarboxylase [Bacteroidota bacterium]HET6243042.1 diaminopimelate decarboxylase [Bacteroidia bacterium]
MYKSVFTAELTQRLKNYKTPFYYYDLSSLGETLKMVKDNAKKYNYIVHYALKANANNKIVQLIRDTGMGADCVSGNEVKKAIELGFNSELIAFAGVGKTDEEINYALDHDIFCFNCESVQELEVIQELAAAKKKKASIALRINPNVNAYTHHYITTGLEENKFGINMWEMDAVLILLKQLPNVELKGLHFHIGSQITDLSAFKNLCLKVNEIQQWFLTKKIILEHINVGGGLGVDYQDPDKNAFPDFNAYFKLFNDFLELQPHQQVHFELGRSIVAQCGNLISRVLYIKNGINTNFAILDAGMTELIRPALYQSYHKIENISKIDKVLDFKYDVVGPICESSDCFGKAVVLPETQRGDLVAIRTAGAYGEVMVSGYNLREQNPVVFG